MYTVGVLAIQGAVAEHIACLDRLPDVEGLAVKTMAEINQVDGLILPGGESTAMGKILGYYNMLEPLRTKIANGLPVWGTCAGLILLAKEITGQPVRYFSTMDITVRRNGYGSQLDSFETTVSLPNVSHGNIPLVFIRAPYIEKVGESVEVLVKIQGHIVAAAQNNMLVTSFHPELTTDLSFHRYFFKHFIQNRAAK
ncbi:pyridoxal 5'-phosphate synthase glutaminase subunit PdxT [Propionispira raffinosivorans]|uniref:pyridoxal 5'-phosphate synthase glutaminase subunit PdxT n=1 Tax=Propionispira raffinosivorans TaxID=86959 RepID=UPI000362E1F2|nr:pyridoxal 5'-phosphate synthase glutaminase subunit PdxT [Propionispira raffinosivorans]